MLNLSKHPRIIAAKVIATYHPLPDEPVVDIEREGKLILLPKVISDTEMELRIFTSDGDLERGAFGIMEPKGKPFYDYDAVEVIIIPGTQFDLSGGRRGRGKGYYDRFLPRLKNAYKIGVCFESQLVSQVQMKAHDVYMDEVITVPLPIM